MTVPASDADAFAALRRAQREARQALVAAREAGWGGDYVERLRSCARTMSHMLAESGESHPRQPNSGAQPQECKTC